MATRKSLEKPRIGKTKPTYLRFPEYLRYYLDRKCDSNSEPGTTLIQIVVESIQNGEYYSQDLARSVELFFAAKPDIADEYRRRFFGRPHHSYVTEEPLDIETLAISDFIREAIDEKMQRMANDYVPETKEERESHWSWLHQKNQ